MALNSRAHAFSVEVLVGKLDKRKLPDPAEKSQPELQGKEDDKERKRYCPEVKKSECPGSSKEVLELESSLKPVASPCSAQKRPKLEPSASLFTGGGSNCGDGGGGGSDKEEGDCEDAVEDRDEEGLGGRLEEKDAIHVELQGSELWKIFHDIGTEMIITKAGRRMFPSVRVKVKGLEPEKQYYLAIDVVPVDSKRYRYVYHSSQWMVAGNTDHTCITPRIYVHPDSPCSGETWMQQTISFDRMKLTNNEMDDKGHIILQSMHKYKPRVHVVEEDNRVDLSQIHSLPTEGVKTFSFKETEFTTVTAYQNQQITKLKIDRNPFAKGFRDPGRNRGILDSLLETYSWRTSLTLDFKTIGTDTPSGHSGSSPVTSSGEPPSPLNPILSPPCSPPTCYLPTNCLGMSCLEASLHNINLPPCYKICPTSFWQQQSLVLPFSENLSNSNIPQSFVPLIMDTPMLSSLEATNSKNDLSENFSGQCVKVPNSVNQILQTLEAPRYISPQNSIAQKVFGCSFYPSYGLYRYKFPILPRLVNGADHPKVNDDSQFSFREVKGNHAYWYPTINHCV
ncbi:T-box transcription factor TBX22 [Echinops telfairi]|uniref:T-box transcription factor TBX22 n=1 Tax=Echinops telfairi TaxID=9371 RepID=A0AC55DNI0_ECHTE|nr:T-box transcription factor TBX22 [Echinops telfairi]